MEKIYYSYDMFKIDALELSFLCKDFTSDAILGIARGGLTLSHFMSQALSQRNVFILNTISYDGRIQKDNVEVFNIPSLEKFRKVLIVDDIIDSGKTIEKVMTLLKNSYPNIEFKVASLFYKEDALVRPDFTINKADKWIDFFWEVDLDLKDKN